MGYFDWLQKNNPTGAVDRYPVIDEHGETSVRGLYVIGDLTGIPLLKLAAESGKRFIDQLAGSPRIAGLRRRHASDPDMLDLLIVGAGPSGVSAGIEALSGGLRFVILEASRRFGTIASFPKGKPIFTEPDALRQRAALKTLPGTKESLLDDLEAQAAAYDLPIREGERVVSIDRQGEGFVVTSVSERGEERYRALVVALAIGKSGSARRLGIDGEDLDKVYSRLIDPAHHRGEEILVVGGGDSAVESAIALAEAGNRVTLSYRGGALSRPRQGNLRRLRELERSGAIELLLDSAPVAITPGHVRLRVPDGERMIANDAVYVMIGTDPPVDLLRRSGVEIRGEWTLRKWMLLLYGVLFACVVYFGKKSTAWNLAGDGGAGGWLAALGSGEFWWRLATLPATIGGRLSDDTSFAWYGWRDAAIDWGAWLGTLLFLAMSLWIVVHVVRRRRDYFTSPWQTFKYAYLALAAGLFLTAFFGGKYFGYRLAGMEPSFWYTLLYSVTIVLFGFRRMHRKPSRYIRLQTWTLMLVQVIPLFLLPEIILPALWRSGALTADSWWVANLFPIQSWNGEPAFWRAYGLVLAWPLFIYNVFDGSPTTFWLVVSFLQTFVLIPLAVLKWGKGAYCGWICSCGGLAETLGDEYRIEAPHGPVPKRWENLGQWVLLFVFLLTAVKLVTVLFAPAGQAPVLEGLAGEGERFYSIVVDILFAGVLGLGVYFFLSGRVWCRFMCPLAALMHIYARFSRYRIFSAKEKCISCNICTSVCHMGIDVMGYANKGIPMDDVECVRCSACIVNCPMDVLSFGELPASDPDNRLYLTLPVVQRPKSDWTSGMLRGEGPGPDGRRALLDR